MEIFLQVTSSLLKFITNYDKLIANYDSFAYYKIRRHVVTNWDSFFLDTNYDNALINCDGHNKLQQNYYKFRQLLQT